MSYIPLINQVFVLRKCLFNPTFCIPKLGFNENLAVLCEVFIKNKYILGFIVIFFLNFSTGSGAGAGYSGEKVRVAIFQDISEFRLSVSGPYKIIDPSPLKLLKYGRAMRQLMVQANPQGIQIGKNLYALDRLRIIDPKSFTIEYQNGKRQFRGQLDIIKKVNGRFLLVNTIDLEDYIKGVLYHEVSHRWPLEVLKAQAVAARTYALYRMSENVSQEFDVTGDIYAQVYGGKTAERYRTRLAVNKTQGQIMTFQGNIIPAYFHATCGGMTEDVSELFKQSLPPLKGITCSYCALSPHYRWKKDFRSKNVQDKLNEHGYHLGLIEEIRIHERNLSGRIRKLEIKTRDGKVTPISGKDFRQILGPNEVKSNNYQVNMRGYYFDLGGQGWGHGIGLCQWGAFAMARKRYHYDEILKYYYPGIEIVIRESERN